MSGMSLNDVRNEIYMRLVSSEAPGWERPFDSTVDPRLWVNEWQRRCDELLCMADVAATAWCEFPDGDGFKDIINEIQSTRDFDRETGRVSGQIASEEK